MFRRLFSRLTIFSVLGSILAAAVPAQSTRILVQEAPNQQTQGPLAFIDHYRQAVDAFRAGDDATMTLTARRALDLAPDQATARYLYAVGRARQGWLGDAVKQLEVLADQGLTTRLEAEAGFVPLVGERQYAPLRARMIANRQALGPSHIAYSAAELSHFIPEGIAYDDKRAHLLLGSVHESRIVRLRGTEDVAENWAHAKQDDMCSVLGMRWNPTGDQLIAATACMAQTQGIDEARRGRSGVLIFNATDGELVSSHWLPVDDQAHVLGDVLPWPDGRVFTSDSMTGAVSVLDVTQSTFSSVIPGGRLPNPQGLVSTPDDQAIIIADYQAGLFRIEPQSQRLERLSNPTGAALHGIDGLNRCQQTVVAIQNGVRPNRILALRLNERGDTIESAEVLARGLPEWDEPTLGTIHDGQLLYVANSHWPRFDADGKLPEDVELDGPRIMSVAVPGCDR